MKCDLGDRIPLMRDARLSSGHNEKAPPVAICATRMVFETTSAERF
jgi:hypothetical protein